MLKNTPIIFDEPEKGEKQIFASQLNNFVFDGVFNQFDCRFHFQFGQDIAFVCVDRPDADAQLFSNFLIQHAFGNTLNDFQFSGR